MTTAIPPCTCIDFRKDEILIRLKIMRIKDSNTYLFSSQVAVTIANEKSVSTVLNSIGRHLLKTDNVTWGKIASLFCVAGGLAIDCVQQGHPEYLYGIIETMGFVIERDAATWIAQQGGWVSRDLSVSLT